jgi:DNA-binding FadR family transcriptional regulator
VLVKKIGRLGLHEHVISEIGRRIISGELPPGKPLPSEMELCITLGVSRTVLREALRVLAAKGLIDAKPKIGTVVQPESVWNCLDVDVLTWRLETGDVDTVIRELYELRYLIEPMAASLAAQHANDDDIEELRQAYTAMEAAGDDGAKLVEPDVRFHRAIIAASGNSLFSSLAHAIGATLTINFTLGIDNPRGQVHTLPFHKNVLDAIAAHDVVGARVAMRKLIEDSVRDIELVRAAKIAPTSSRRVPAG